MLGSLCLVMLLNSTTVIKCRRISASCARMNSRLTTRRSLVSLSRKTAPRILRTITRVSSLPNRSRRTTSASTPRLSTLVLAVVSLLAAVTAPSWVKLPASRRRRPPRIHRFPRRSKSSSSSSLALPLRSVWFSSLLVLPTVPPLFKT